MGRQCVKFSSLWNLRQVPFKLKLVSFGRSPNPRLSHPLLSFGTRSYKSREHEPDSSRIKCCDKDASLGILLKFETWNIVNAFSRSVERLCTQSYKVQMQNQQTNTRSQITSSNKYFVTWNTLKKCPKTKLCMWNPCQACPSYSNSSLLQQAAGDSAGLSFTITQ